MYDLQNAVQIARTGQVVYGSIVKMKRPSLIANTKVPKFFKSKAKILGKTVTQPSSNNGNRNIKNVTIPIPLKYGSNFLRSLEIPLTN